MNLINLHEKINNLPYGLIQSPLNKNCTVIKYPVTLVGKKNIGVMDTIVETFGIMSFDGSSQASFPHYFNKPDFNIQDEQWWNLFLDILQKPKSIKIYS